jgi:hypothetical protein
VNVPSSPNGDRSRWAWYLLLVVPFVAIVWVPFYVSGEPAFFGIPYFYWYQFVWILISAVLTAIVYFATREPERIVSDTREPTPVEDYR